MTPAQYTQLPLIPGDHRSAYGDLPAQFGELFVPRSAPENLQPVIILMHGGCWRDRFGLEPLGQLARRLTDHGCAVWNLEYRRLGGGGGWPATFLDVAAGADHLRELARKFSLDVGRVMAAGHSAGGHLALWLAGRNALASPSTLYSPNPLPIKSVVSLAGIPDLELAAAENICGGAPEELMGGTAVEFPERYAQGSPLAGPSLTVPQWHVVGEQDRLVSAHYVRRCVRRARARGEAAELIPVAGSGHFEIVTATSAVWPTVEATIVHALDAAGK